MNTNQNPPAFPIPNPDSYHGLQLDDAQGMSLRDYFAAKAMANLIPVEGWIEDYVEKHANDAAKQAYQIADAMLAARQGR